MWRSPVKRPTHFEIPVDDPDRAEKFYGAVFGWTFQRFEGAPEYYGMTTTGEGGQGINGALFQRRDDSTTALTMDVDSIEDAIASITGQGGKVVQGKTPIPSMGWFATCEDTEGNKFGLFTNDASAS
jgi:predicted enzyme related to lactoylglutathione lyase